MSNQEVELGTPVWKWRDKKIKKRSIHPQVMVLARLLRLARRRRNFVALAAAAALALLAAAACLGRVAVDVVPHEEQEEEEEEMVVRTPLKHSGMRVVFFFQYGALVVGEEEAW